MNSKNTKSTAELHAEVRNELNNVNAGIDRIKGRMTPGQLIDDAIFYPAGADPRATFEKLRLNPIGTTFLAMGTLLLMEDSSHRTYEATARIRGQETMGQLKAKTGAIKAEAQGAIHNLKSSVQTKVASVKQKVNDRVDRFKSHPTVSGDESFYDVGGVGISSKGPAEASGKIDELKHQLSEKVESIQEKFHDINPMAFVGLGLGLGALTGAAVPMAEKEHAIVAEKLSSPLGQFKQELQQALNKSVNILRDEFIHQLQGQDFELFKGVPPASESRI